ncbi:hypothetical protein [Kitasatospora sp. NPDC094011]|uniref:hypothetical protein n=1 Tax=Kitasatospora sp. NPDC094011 TaxID=3364090 RepID=UPI00381DF236
MSAGTGTFLIGAAFVVLLALAFATVVLGVITALRMPSADDEQAAPEHQDHKRRSSV